MKTHHLIHYSSSKHMTGIEDNSIALVVTSPPYPMIEMWDDLFASMNPEIQESLDDNDGDLAFELMHAELDCVWKEVARVLSPGGMVCVNIGDATRSIGKIFKLYPSHSRIISTFITLGFQCLPSILWQKPTNSPTKFMGSGMLPPGAYVTLEREHILLFRKGDRRKFNDKQIKQIRRKSAYFWEERNTWFSDLWNLKGSRQTLDIIGKNDIRDRTAAFPFELPFRLINMFSIQGDTVLDPFLGTGTTMLAAITSARNCIGFEINQGFTEIIEENILNLTGEANNIIDQRLTNHRGFIENREAEKGPPKYWNDHHGFGVVTSQERFIEIPHITGITKIASEGRFEVSYST